MNKIIEKIINDISLDDRIDDGIFNVDKIEHIDILREYLIKKGMKKDVVVEFCNKIIEGKHPERQAYNKDGLLVTFPTPEYKKRAIERGTHFEQDPTKKPANIFTSDQPSSPPSVSPPATADGSVSPSTQPAPTTSLPASPTQSKIPTDDKKQMSLTPNSTSMGSETPGEIPAIKPLPEPTAIIKSPEEKDADKKVIKNMLKGDDYMLEENDIMNEDWLEYWTKKIPKAKVPSKLSLKDQLKDLLIISNRFGFYEASEFIKKIIM